MVSSIISASAPKRPKNKSSFGRATAKTVKKKAEDDDDDDALIPKSSRGNFII